MFRRSAFAAIAFLLPFAAQAQSADETPARLHVELNRIEDVEGACRLTFVAQNGTGTAIDNASFETVVFDTSGGVVTLALYNFRELPTGVLRVRQFLVRDVTCDQVGRTLINGVNSCVVGGSESEICSEALTLSSRTDVELLG